MFSEMALLSGNLRGDIPFVFRTLGDEKRRLDSKIVGDSKNYQVL
jgi:hypothetical protein